MVGEPSLVPSFSSLPVPKAACGPGNEARASLRKECSTDSIYSLLVSALLYFVVFHCEVSTRKCMCVYGI